ncbi:MAG: DMT family transporter [Promethearchaeota archaeon]
MQSQHKSKSFLFIAIAIWGISPVFLEFILDYLSPLHAITMRFGIAVLVLTFYVFLFKRRNGFSLLSSKTCIFLGWLDAFGYLTATIGQKMTTAGLATLISAFYVFIVPFLAWKHEGTKLDRKIMVGGLAALSGIFFICFDGEWSNFSSLSSLGILFLMFAALLWAFYIVVSSHFLSLSEKEERNIDLVSFLYSILFHAFIPLIVLSMITPRSSVSLPLEIILFLLFLALFPTIFAKGLYNLAITRIGSVQTSFYLLLQVIIPFICELIFFQQNYSGWVYIGIFILIIATSQIHERNVSSMRDDQPIRTSKLQFIEKAGYLKQTKNMKVIFCEKHTS